MRLAVFTVSPHTLYEIFLRAMTPAISGPVLMPVRKSRASGSIDELELPAAPPDFRNPMSACCSSTERGQR
jgi:hypothetical protein